MISPRMYTMGIFIVFLLLLVLANEYTEETLDFSVFLFRPLEVRCFFHSQITNVYTHTHTKWFYQLLMIENGLYHEW